MGQEDSNYWQFDNIFCRLNGYRKGIILEAIYQQSEKVQYQRQLTTTVKTNIFQRQITTILASSGATHLPRRHRWL